MQTDNAVAIGKIGKPRRRGAFESRFHFEGGSTPSNESEIKPNAPRAARRDRPNTGSAGDNQGTRIIVTERQRFVLAQIAVSVDLFGVPPTVRELCVALNVTSTQGVSNHIEALERKGLLTRRGGAASRGIRLTALGQLYAVGGDLRCDHELTRDEYVARELEEAQRALAARHEAIVAAAVAGAVDVPGRVLADYAHLGGVR